MHLILHITEQCNLRCHYCYAAPHRDAVMSRAVLERALHLAVEDHLARFPGQQLGILFFGGEPLLQRELLRETMRLARHIGQESGVVFAGKLATNGILLDEEFFRDRETRDLFVTLSHDGVPVAHDAHRVDAAGAGSFARLEPIIELLLRHRPHAPVVTVVNPDTLPHFAASIEYLYARGFRVFMPSLNYGAQWTEADMAILAREYRRLAQWYTTVTLAGTEVEFSPFDGKIANRVTGDNCPRERCDLGMREVSIAPDGGIYPCLQFVNDAAFRIGHVTTGIDFPRRARLLAQADAAPAACSACSLQPRCDNFCGCLNKQSTGRVTDVSPILCAHERTLLPIADQLAADLYQQRAPVFMRKFYG